MVKEKDLFNGLKFKADHIYEIYKIDSGLIRSLRTNRIYRGYSKQEIVNYINNGHWVLLEPLIKTYELW